MWVRVAAIASLAVLASAGSSVVDLTDTNFEANVKSGGVWLVEYVVTDFARRCVVVFVVPLLPGGVFRLLRSPRATIVLGPSPDRPTPDRSPRMSSWR